MTMTDEQCQIMRKTIEHIIGNPKEWNQVHWGLQVTSVERDMPCSTAFCFAGHAAVTVAGATPNWSDKYWTFRSDDDDTPFRRSLDWVRPVESTLDVGVADYAKQLMGLSDVQATALFQATNSLELIVDYCHELSDGRVDYREQVRAL